MSPWPSCFAACASSRRGRVMRMAVYAVRIRPSRLASMAAVHSSWNRGTNPVLKSSSRLWMNTAPTVSPRLDRGMATVMTAFFPK